jgi:hypothetical protein
LTAAIDRFLWGNSNGATGATAIATGQWGRGVGAGATAIAMGQRQSINRVLYRSAKRRNGATAGDGGDRSIAIAMAMGKEDWGTGAGATGQ